MWLDWSPFWISIKTSLVATGITFLVGMAAACRLAGKKGRMSRVLDGFFTLPLVLPPTVVGFFLLLGFGRSGPLGIMLEHLGTGMVFTWPAAVMAAAVVSFPMMYRTARGAFEQVDESLAQAARTLGAGEWRVFWRIRFPLAWPGIAAGTVLAFARALGEFGATMLVAGNIPGRTQTLPLAIYFAAEGGDWEKALLWAMLLVGFSLMVIFLMNYRSQRRDQYESEKGVKSWHSLSASVKYFADTRWRWILLLPVIRWVCWVHPAREKA